MAMRLGEHLLYGELLHDGNISTSGRLVFATSDPDEPHFVLVQFVGNPAAEFLNGVVRFYPPEDGPQPTPLSEQDQRALGLDQIGSVGDITSQGWVRTLPCSIDEFLSRVKLGEPPPTEWKRRVYVEWYGRTGRVVLELPGYNVERMLEAPSEEHPDGQWESIPNLAFPFHLAPEDKQPGLQVVECTADENPPVEDLPHFPPASTDAPDVIRELELLDKALDERTEVPILDLLEAQGPLTRPQALNEADAETALKVLAMRLATLNVAVDICKHCTPMQAYALLLNEMLPDTHVYPKLIGSAHIQHICTWEFCAQCEEEAELR